MKICFQTSFSPVSSDVYYTFTISHCFLVLFVSPFLLCLPASIRSQAGITRGLLTFVWVQQHSIKLVKYAQGYLRQPERLWTYMSPSNRCTDYGLQLVPEEWVKQPVSLSQTKPSYNVLFLKKKVQVVSNTGTYYY